MCHYHHLTLVEHEKIMFFHAQDNSVSAIAKKLGRNKAIISRELRRNTKNGFYQPATAQRQGDTVAGKTGKACLVTLVDRKTRFLVGGKSSAKRVADVNEVMLIALEGHPVKSITPDSGKEFAKHAEVTEALEGVKFYFPPPHHPWERGSNENTNGLLREYFPKGQDITDIPDAYIQEMFDKLNRRPRKCLGYRTPYEVYYSKTLHLT